MKSSPYSPLNGMIKAGTNYPRQDSNLAPKSPEKPENTSTDVLPAVLSVTRSVDTDVLVALIQAWPTLTAETQQRIREFVSRQSERK